VLIIITVVNVIINVLLTITIITMIYYYC